MKVETLKKIIKDFLYPEIESDGWRFLIKTQQKKPIKRRKINIPESWKKVYYKIYPRFPQIPLKTSLSQKNKSAYKDFLEIFLKRASRRDFSGKKIPFDIFSTLLIFSAGIRDRVKSAKSWPGEIMKKDRNLLRRTWPSGGARYPLEIYIIALKIQNLVPGLYHYNVLWDTLELLEKKDFSNKIKKISSQEFVQKASAIIIITAVFNRTIIKYKERGWRLIFFEAGHLAQNIYLVSTILNLKCCALGGFCDSEIIALLDIDEHNEIPLYLVAIGK